MEALKSRSISNPQLSHRKTRSDKGIESFSVWHLEQVLVEGYHRSTTIKVDPYNWHLYSNFNYPHLFTMTLPESSRLQLAPDLNICRLLNGLWQVSGAHGRIDPKKAIPSMFDYLDAGFTTWDLADHYGPAEDFIGEFKRQLVATRGEEALANIQAFTKWYPAQVG